MVDAPKWAAKFPPVRDLEPLRPLSTDFQIAAIAAPVEFVFAPLSPMIQFFSSDQYTYSKQSSLQQQGSLSKDDEDITLQKLKLIRSIVVLDKRMISVIINLSSAGHLLRSARSAQC